LARQGEDLKNEATRRGINSLNIPTRSAPGANLSDDTDKSKTDNTPAPDVQLGSPVSAPSARNGERAAQILPDRSPRSGRELAELPRTPAPYRRRHFIHSIMTITASNAARKMIVKMIHSRAIAT
jgi:hypothetical protein